MNLHPIYISARGKKPAFVLTVFLLVVSSLAQSKSSRIAAFEHLSGQEKVEKFFHDGFGPYFFFRQIGELPYDMQMEEDLLIKLSDGTINDALAGKARGTDQVKASYAIYLICMRARFIPPGNLLFQSTNGRRINYSQSHPDGSKILYEPDFSRVSVEAEKAVKEALNSPDPKIKATALLYSGQSARDLDSWPTEVLVQRWSDSFDRLPSPKWRSLSYSSEEGDRFKCFDSALAFRGLEGAIAIGRKLLEETNTEKRDKEIEALLHIDRSSGRLRDTARGREVITIVRNVIATQKLFFYETAAERASYRQRVEGEFMSDH